MVVKTGLIVLQICLKRSVKNKIIFSHDGNVQSNVKSKREVGDDLVIGFCIFSLNFAPCQD